MTAFVPSTYTYYMMDENIGLFFDAAIEVFSELGFTEAQYKGDTLIITDQGIIANVGITGEYQGFLVIQTDIDSALSFVRKMLENLEMEQEDSGFGQFHKEAIGEIVNQVSGRATMKLSENDVDCSITPPTILSGNNLFFDLKQFSILKTQVLNGGFGEISITLGLK